MAMFDIPPPLPEMKWSSMPSNLMQGGARFGEDLRAIQAQADTVDTSLSL
jgi:hypothetical protein